MITIRRARDRRHHQEGGRDTWMTFDADGGSDPLGKGFRSLEALNEEGLEPGIGILLHPERDVDMFTYLREGSLVQDDPASPRIVLEAGECRRTSSRSPTTHRAVNPSPSDTTRAIQCRIRSDRTLLRPGPEQRRFPMAERRGILRLLASPDGRDASLRMRQDLRVYSSLLDPGQHLFHELTPGRAAWLHVVEGRIALADHELRTGDGASLVEETAVSLTAREPSEILLFDLA
jgi:hypothetical protein